MRLETSITITKGTGIRVDSHNEIFQIGKDWLLFDFNTQSGHWFSGKRDAMRFLKLNRKEKGNDEILNYPGIALTL